MEFGALQCVPRNPDCGNCPLQHSCYALLNKKVEVYPIKEKKTKQTSRYFYYYLIEQADAIYLEKRTGNDIWRNLYQFPLTETKNALNDRQLIQQNIPGLSNNSAFNVVSVSETKKHILSHQIIWARLIRVEISKDVTIENPFIKVNKKDISKFAVPRLLEHFIEAIDFNDEKTNNNQ